MFLSLLTSIKSIILYNVVFDFLEYSCLGNVDKTQKWCKDNHKWHLMVI